MIEVYYIYGIRHKEPLGVSHLVAICATRERAEQLIDDATDHYTGRYWSSSVLCGYDSCNIDTVEIDPAVMALFSK